MKITALYLPFFQKGLRRKRNGVSYLVSPEGFHLDSNCPPDSWQMRISLSHNLFATFKVDKLFEFPEEDRRIVVPWFSSLKIYFADDEEEIKVSLTDNSDVDAIIQQLLELGWTKETNLPVD